MLAKMILSGNLSSLRVVPDMNSCSWCSRCTDVPLFARTRVTISPSVKNRCTSEIRPICFAFLFVGEESFSLSAKGLLPPTFDTATFRVGDLTVRMRFLTTHGIAGFTRVSNFSGVLNNDIKLFKFGGDYREFFSCNVQLVFWLFFSISH